MAEKCEIFSTFLGDMVGVVASYCGEEVFHPWLSVADEAAREWARRELALPEGVEIEVNIQRDALGYVNP